MSDRETADALAKSCSSCRVTLPRENFRAAKTNRDGSRGQCKRCVSEAMRRYRQTMDPARKKEHQRAYRLRHPERLTQQRKTFRAENPEKHKAHQAVTSAIRYGRLVRPAQCEWCQSACKPEASHGDYSRPLEVLWLCTKCHRRRDRGIAA